MVSGLTGASRHQHSHFLRDLNRSARTDASTKDPALSTTESPDDQDTQTEKSDPAANGYDDMIKALEERDHHVIEHEAAHMAAGGAFVKGSATYTYQVGPDGKSYAIGGEVGVDVSSVPGDPRATIEKMQAIQAAARSPDDPSSADMAVASAAAQIETSARAQLAQESRAATAALTKQRGSDAYKSSTTRPGQLVNATA